MLYLVYANTQDAVDRTAEIAIELGCHPQTTAYWYDWIIHPTLPPATALVIPNNQTQYLTPSEQSLLQTEAEMEANGWFD